jgi:glycerol-3-phosphate dehydrogenase
MVPIEAIGKMKAEKKSVEGYPSAKAFYDISVKEGLHTPILKHIYSILYEGAKPDEALFKGFEAH